MDSVYVVFRQGTGDAQVKEFRLPLTNNKTQNTEIICTAIWRYLPTPATLILIADESQQIVVTRDEWNDWIQFHPHQDETSTPKNEPLRLGK